MPDWRCHPDPAGFPCVISGKITVKRGLSIELGVTSSLPGEGYEPSRGHRIQIALRHVCRGAPHAIWIVGIIAQSVSHVKNIIL